MKLLIASILVAISYAQTGILEDRHHNYAGSEDDKQQLDVYWPDQPVPAGGWTSIMAIHGQGGSKQSFRKFCQIIAQTGRLCIAFDYREDTSVMKDDCDLGLTWVLSEPQVSNWNINPDKMIIFGNSRGGFNTISLVTNNKYDESRMKGVVISNGVGENAWKNTNKYWMPVLVISSETDGVVPGIQSVNFANAMEEAGKDITFVYMCCYGHNPRTATGSLYQHVSDFLARWDFVHPPIVDYSEWPNIANNLKCFETTDDDLTVGITKTACEELAASRGHVFIFYNSDEETCATSDVCDDALRNQSGWSVYWYPTPDHLSYPGDQALEPGESGETSSSTTSSASSSTESTTTTSTSPPDPDSCYGANPTNAVWDAARCQERCGDPAGCVAGTSTCDNQCSAGCVCGQDEDNFDIGEDLCDNVVCVALDECHEVDVCSEGVCENPLKLDGTSCSIGVCEAGVCTVAADCAGVPNGSAVEDACGVCSGDGTTCADCAGVPNGSAVEDACGVCSGDGTTCADCAGVPNGSAVEDACGVCSGDGTTCADCAGVPNGSAVEDACGVCSGDGTTCDSCADVVCTALSECHSAGSCIEGNCSNPMREDGYACSTGTCQSGECITNTPDLGDWTEYSQNQVCHHNDRLLSQNRVDDIYACVMFCKDYLFASLRSNRKCQCYDVCDYTRVIYDDTAVTYSKEARSGYDGGCVNPPGLLHEVFTRTRYQKAVAETCARQEQTMRCESDGWGEYYPSDYTAERCDVLHAYVKTTLTVSGITTFGDDIKAALIAAFAEAINVDVGRIDMKLQTSRRRLEGDTTILVTVETISSTEASIISSSIKEAAFKDNLNTEIAGNLDTSYSVSDVTGTTTENVSTSSEAVTTENGDDSTIDEWLAFGLAFAGSALLCVCVLGGCYYTLRTSKQEEIYTYSIGGKELPQAPTAGHSDMEYGVQEKKREPRTSTAKGANEFWDDIGYKQEDDSMLNPYHHATSPRDQPYSSMELTPSMINAGARVSQSFQAQISNPEWDTTAAFGSGEA